MHPLLPPHSPPNAEEPDHPAHLKATLVLSPTEVSPARLGEGREVRECDEDPPTEEWEILAAVQETRQKVETAALDPEELLDLVCRRTQYLTEAAGAVVELLEGNELVYRAATGSAARSLGLRVDTQKSLSGLCFRTGEALRCDDVERDGRVDQAACRWAGIRSMLLVPVIGANQSVGVLAVVAPSAAAFGDRDLWVVRLMAQLLGQALGKVDVGDSP
jgi:putative methionine-R-sulfoxide reductase with GAF domain